MQKKAQWHQQARREENLRAQTSSPEHGVVVGVFGRLAAVAVTLWDEAVLPLEALGALGHDGHALPHPLAQALSPLVGDDADDAHGEGVWRGAVGVAHGQTGQDPDVARPQQAHLGRQAEQELSLLVGAVGQQHLGVYLQAGNSCLSVRMEVWTRVLGRLYESTTIKVQ